ncbi:MAG: HNH endonuclease signature motif containing protein, partial [Arthrobacter sp.]
KCTFPGCTNHTPDNETDHLQAWKHGGSTDVSNLAQLCPKHHRLKHHSQWTPDPATNNDPPGWTSPTGRHYKPEHPDTEPTQWPAGILPMEAVACAAEDLEWEPLLADMPNWPDPPPEEPPAENLLDPSGLCPTDPLWEDFYAQPFNLPPDPEAASWLLLSLM